MTAALRPTFPTRSREAEFASRYESSNIRRGFPHHRKVFPLSLTSKDAGLCGIGAGIQRESAAQPLWYEPIYNVTKSALMMFSKVLAIEVVGHNIRVNCVNPGLILTPDWIKRPSSSPRRRMATGAGTSMGWRANMPSSSASEPRRNWRTSSSSYARTELLRRVDLLRRWRHEDPVGILCRDRGRPGSRAQAGGPRSVDQRRAVGVTPVASLLTVFRLRERTGSSPIRHQGTIGRR